MQHFCHQTITGQLVKAVKEAPLETRPCESIHLSEIFDSGLYLEIVRRLPPAIYMDDFSCPDEGSKDEPVKRKLIDLTEASIARFVEQDRDFWREIMRAFCSPELYDALIEKFKVTISNRFGDDMPDIVIVPIIYRDFSGYRSAIHPGPSSEVVTLQINLPSDTAQSHLGTSFHAPADMGFQVIRKHLFLPNSGFAFARSDESLSSVDQMGENEFARSSIAVKIYLAGQEYRSNPNWERSLVKKLAAQPSPRAAPSRREQIAALGLGAPESVETAAGAIRYLPLGGGWRFRSLLSKEPETIAWIDSLGDECVFWDIGANVGIYSIYAALRGHRVFAFEPHFANYFQLCANIFANSFESRVTALCMACAERPGFSHFNLANTAFGSALSSFGNNLDFRGRPYEVAFSQGMIGYDLDGVCGVLGVPKPKHMKIDVDGLELAIIRGGKSVLSDPNFSSLSVELVETDGELTEAVHSALAAAGLEFVHKRANPASRDKDVLNYLYRRRR